MRFHRAFRYVLGTHITSGKWRILLNTAAMKKDKTDLASVLAAFENYLTPQTGHIEIREHGYAVLVLKECLGENKFSLQDALLIHRHMKYKPLFKYPEHATRTFIVADKSLLEAYWKDVQHSRMRIETWRSRRAACWLANKLNLLYRRPAFIMVYEKTKLLDHPLCYVSYYREISERTEQRIRSYLLSRGRPVIDIPYGSKLHNFLNWYWVQD